ncbi:MAG: 3-hydroxy-3-methylglutaryl-CoA reductase, partial [Nitrososphaerota archaeon]
MSEKTSRIPKFYQLSVEERLRIVSEFAGLSSEEQEMLLKGGLDIATANRMIENVIGIFQIPLGIAVNFLIDGKDYLIPMVIEEPSVVAAASNAARWAREGGGIETWASEQIMIGQIQLVGVKDPYAARFEIIKRKEEL